MMRLPSYGSAERYQAHWRSSGGETRDVALVVGASRLFAILLSS